MATKRPKGNPEPRGFTGVIGTLIARVGGLRQRLASAPDQIAQKMGEVYKVLYNSADVTSQVMGEGAAVRRDKVYPPMRPSDTIDDDISTGAVFLVVILLIVVVAAALFFAMSSTFPSFAGPS